MKRTELREATFLLLFRCDYYNEKELEEQIDMFFFGEDAFSDAEKEYITKKTKAVAEKKEEIDKAIDGVTVGWKTKRMSRVDLTLLRLAYYEALYDDSVPVSTAIDEAVELAKNYGTDNSRSFVNGILAKLLNKPTVPDEQLGI